LSRRVAKCVMRPLHLLCDPTTLRKRANLLLFHRNWSLLMFKYLAIVSGVLTAHALYALTTLNVTVSSDNDPGGFGDVGDLRYCLNTMNQSLNTIADDYAIVFAFPMTIQLNGILPIINSSSNSVNITIGNSSSISMVTIDGNSGAYSGFFIPMGNVTIQ